MQIRTRLTLQFLSFGAIILLLSFSAIFFFSSDYRKEDFYNRLHNKAINTAKLLIEVEEVDVNLLKRIEKDNPTSLPREKVIIFDQTDSTIFSTDEEHFLKLPEGLLKKIWDQGEVRFMQGDFQVLGLVYDNQGDKFVVIASATDIYGYRKITNLLKILGVVSVFCLMVLLGAGWFYSGRALNPISTVIRRVDEISITSLNLRVDEGNGQDEIARLAQTFNKMLDRLETAFQMQKNFIANASHELRTPLTAISGQLEVLLLKKRKPEDYERAVASILEDMKNLNQISNRLLLLAQASAAGRNARFEEIRVDEILWQAQEDLLKRNPDFRIHVMIDQSIEEERSLTIRGDAQLTRTAILNLMENGCKFSPGHEVLVEVFNPDQSIKILFIDHGIGIFPEDLEHIFEPFHRGSNVGQIKGHGIGLSLAERVVRLQSGTISIDSKPNEGTTITLTFPLA